MSFKGEPAVTVAMSVYNGERFLDEAIRSVLAQTFGDFEFLILDDGSTDSSAAIIHAHAAGDSRIRPILRENRGLIASLNQLIDEARAPLIARMDADDVCRPERFARQVAFLAAHPDHGIVGCWTEDIDETGADYGLCGEDQPLTHEQFLASIERGGSLLCHPGVIYRRDVVMAAGGYHAAFRHCEDYDLWLRMASLTKVANLPERLLLYRHYPEQVSSRHLTEQQIGAAVSRLAYEERKAGRPDPTEALLVLPPVEKLDALFMREGVAQAVRAHLATAVLYSPTSLRDGALDHIIQHVRDGGSHEALWRTVARLVKLGEPARALRLAGALLRNAEREGAMPMRLAAAAGANGDTVSVMSAMVI